MGATLELLVEREGDLLRLLAPDAGVFTCALDRGAALAPGQSAGSLGRLGGAARLVVPAGAAGLVTSARPERVHAPVGYGDVLYVLDPSGSRIEGAADAAAPGDAGEAGELVLRATTSGRFYHRPSPDEPRFCGAGDVLEDGAPVGLVEVMKTFSTVPFRAGGGLPARARVVRFVAGDGADVDAGDPLVEVEPA